METNQRKRFFLIGITAFLVVAASIFLVFAIFKFEVIKGFALTLWGILEPFVFGFVLAYMLLPLFNILCGLTEKILLRGKMTEKSLKKRKVAANAMAVFITFALFLALLVGFGFLVLPGLYNGVATLVNNAPDTGMKIVAWAQKVLSDNPKIEVTVTELITRYVGNISNWAETYILPYITGLLNGISAGLLGTIAGTFNVVKNILIGIVAAIYMLVSKNIFAAQAKKLIYSVFKLRQANIFLENMRFVHRTFSGFITGKLLDALIIGVICYTFMMIAGLPYPMLISVIIGVTNIIPFFGPFIGGIPSVLLVLTVSPIQCLYFIIFIIILQQFDSNVLEPRIISGSVGISSFWVMFSIIFFAGLFGFTGMLIGVPLCALLLSLISALCKRSLEGKGLPVESEAYMRVESVDPDTRELVSLPPVTGYRGKPDGVIAKMIEKWKEKKRG